MDLNHQGATNPLCKFALTCTRTATTQNFMVHTASRHERHPHPHPPTYNCTSFRGDLQNLRRMPSGSEKRYFCFSRCSIQKRTNKVLSNCRNSQKKWSVGISSQGFAADLKNQSYFIVGPHISEFRRECLGMRTLYFIFCYSLNEF